MNWWGKLLGSGLGFMFGGPLGAMLGMAVGHNIDTGNMGWVGKRSKNSSDNTQISTAFFNVTFRVMGYVAKRDGRVSESEIAAAQAVMAHMRLTSSQKKTAIELFQEGKRKDFNLDAALTLLHHHCGKQPHLIRRFINVQLSTAYADGNLPPSKRKLLLYMCDRLGFSRLSFEALESFARRRYQSGAGPGPNRPNNHRQRQRETPGPTTRRDLLADAYTTLGLVRTSKEEDIKRAYRKLISQYHPDKLAARNLSQELMAKATDKTREIKAAYERIKQARGF